MCVYIFLFISVISDSSGLHLGFSWQSYCSGLPFPSPTHLIDEETEANRVKRLATVTHLASF